MDPETSETIRAVRRAEAPQVWFTDDIALHFRLPDGVARTLLEAGCFGPSFTVEGDLAVLKEDLWEHLRLRRLQRRRADREVVQQEVPTTGPTLLPRSPQGTETEEGHE